MEGSGTSVDFGSLPSSRVAQATVDIGAVPSNKFAQATVDIGAVPSDKFREHTAKEGAIQNNYLAGKVLVMAGAICFLALTGAVATVLVLDMVDKAKAAPVGRSEAVPAGRSEAVPLGRRELPVSKNYTEEFFESRKSAMAKDKARILGSRHVFNGKEAFLDEKLRTFKRRYIEDNYLKQLEYPPGLTFQDNHDKIKTTLPYSIIQAMPKGAALHLHEPAITSLEWLVKNVTYRENVYMCTDSDSLILLNYFQLQPSNVTDCEWKLVADERNAASDIQDFDQNLIDHLSLLNEKFLNKYAGTVDAWKRFNRYFDQVIPLVFYAPILRDYLRQAMQEFMDDNVQYMEIRGQMRGYKEFDGTERDAAYGVNLFKSVSDEFVKNNKNFQGAKVIMSGLRFKTADVIQEEVKLAIELREQFPDYFLGYDLVAEEDPNKPLLYYLDALIYPVQHARPLPYFFHAGETKWLGTDVDDNLMDAILLNTSRIGHGYALAKHPEWVEMARNKNIPVEVNPISNQILGLVDDLRNHPMTNLMADDFPVVISSDDPASWNASPLTDDFYMAFMTMSGADTGLGFLKQLAINSIKYCALNPKEKEELMNLWQRLWDEFVEAQYAKYH